MEELPEKNVVLSKCRTRWPTFRYFLHQQQLHYRNKYKIIRWLVQLPAGLCKRIVLLFYMKESICRVKAHTQPPFIANEMASQLQSGKLFFLCPARIYFYEIIVFKGKDGHRGLGYLTHVIFAIEHKANEVLILVAIGSGKDGELRE